MPPTPQPKVLPRHDPALESDRILLRMHATLTMDSFWRKLAQAVNLLLPNHSVSGYCNYFDQGDAFRLYHHQSVPGALLPWEERQSATPTPNFLRTHIGIRLFQLREMLPDEDDPTHSDYYRLVMRKEGWDTLACLAFWNDRRPTFMLVIRRTAEQSEFNRREVEILHEISRHVDVSLARLRVAERERNQRFAVEQFALHSDAPALLLTWDGRLRWRNSAAARACLAWLVGPDRARGLQPNAFLEVPEEIAAACAQLRGRLEPSSPRVEVAAKRVPGAVAAVESVAAHGALFTRPLFVVRFGRRARTAMSEPALPLAKLTPTEREVLAVLKTGASNQEIANSLGKSIRTVKAQVTGIYRKFGVASRAQLQAALAPATGAPTEARIK